MNTELGRAEIGQWYRRSDKGETFRVTGYDERSRTIETQSFDGDLDEIDEETWSTLPLERVEQPEDWTGPVDDVEFDDLGYTATEMRDAEWTEPLQPFRSGQEAWEDETPEEDRDPESEGQPAEELVAEDVTVSEQLG